MKKANITLFLGLCLLASASAQTDAVNEATSLECALESSTEECVNLLSQCVNDEDAESCENLVAQSCVTKEVLEVCQSQAAEEATTEEATTEEATGSE